MTLQLRPRMLDDFGLTPALRWHAENFTKMTGIALSVSIILPTARIGRELEVAAYRLVQEGLTNVARHSGAPSAALSVDLKDEVMTVRLEDRGKGFETQKGLAKHDSVGLSGLIERVRLVGGSLVIESMVGQGTTLLAQFPVETERSNRRA